MDEAERQLLEYLSGLPRGRALVCEPHLAAAALRMCLRTDRLVTDVYEGPEGCVTVMISQAGRAALIA
jgi:hypothetical protein